MIIPWLHRDTEHAVELRAIPNVRGTGSPQSIQTRDVDDIEVFVRRHDRPGWSVYFGVATRLRQPCTVRNCAELPAVWIDIDGAKPLDALMGCFHPPSCIVDSGGGLHAYWLLAEPLDITETEHNDGHPAVALMQGLARIFASDRSVADLARVMRLPGTTNTKRDTPVECRVLYQSDTRYEFDDLAEWASWQPQLIGEPVDPFLAAAEKLGIRSRVDPDELLAGITYPGNVHDVQLRVSAHFAAAGRPEDEVVDLLLEATKLAAGREGTRWNWGDERKAIAKMYREAVKKFGSQVVNLETERKKRVNGPDDVTEKDHVIRKVAAIALEAWGRPIITVNGEMHTFEGGVWHAIDQGWEHRLRSCIQGAVAALKLAPNNSTLNGAYRLIYEAPGHLRLDVEWDRCGVVVARNGAFNVETGEVSAHSQEHYATRRIDCDVRAGAECPKWLRFLEEAMPDGAASVFQEWLGAALVRGKTRELTKGMILYGPSRTGKTQVSDVVRAVLGGNTCGLRLKAIGERFGMQPLLNASGWIADDAVSQREVMDAEAYKVIVTGESTSIERKNKCAVETKLDLPVLLTMNAFPVVRDDSDAVYNRSLVIPMRRVQSEKEARPIAATVIAEELSGVLLWAAEGWRRLKKRGWYDLPESMADAAKDYRGSNNAFIEFAELCLNKNPDRMILRSDLRATFNSWFTTEIEGKREWSGNAVASALKSHIPDIRGERDPGERGRVWVGVEFTKDAIPYMNRFGEPAKSISDVNFGVPLSLQKRVRGAVF